MPGGRPSKLTEEIINKVRKLACLGLTDKQFAAVMEVNQATWYRWKKDAEFCEALKGNKEDSDVAVEASLWQRANGYSHPEDKIFLGKAGVPVIVPTIKHYPPDPTSMIFWLKNRQPDKWRDKTEVELKTIDEKLADLAKKRGQTE